MSADEKLAALGLADVEVVPREVFNHLPEHRRLLLGPMPDGEFRRLRLPDPAPVAALREILLTASQPRDGVDLRSGLAYIREQAEEALAEFDGTTT